MVNSQVVKEISNALKIDERVEKIPSAIPVIEVGLKATKTNIVREALMVNETSTVLLYTPENKDFYLDFASLTYKSNAGACVSASLQIITDENTINLLTIADINGSTTTNSVTYTGKPIKLRRNRAITLILDTAELTTTAAATITGFIDEID